MLSRRAQIEKLENEVAEIERRSAEADKKAAELDENEQSLKKEESTVLGSAAVIKTLRDAEATQLEVIRSNISVSTEAIARLKDEESAAGVRAEKDGESVEALEKKEEEYREKQAALIRSIADISSEQREMMAEIETLRAHRSELEKSLAIEEKAFELKSENAKASKARLDAQEQALSSEKENA